MTLALGALTLALVGQNTATITVPTATSGTAPYTYQMYRSTTSGFTPGGGYIISGATGQTVNDTGLIPNTTYYYVCVVTDNASATASSAQLTVVTTPQTMSQNQFAQNTLIGQVDLAHSSNTKQVQVASTQSGPLYPGTAVKWVGTNPGGVPQVVACAAATDTVYGYVNYDLKNPSFPAGSMCGISQDGNVMYLPVTAATSAGAQLQSDCVNNGVITKVGSSGASLVGWAIDQGAGPGSVIRVQIKTPSFLTA